MEDSSRGVEKHAADDCHSGPGSTSNDAFRGDYSAVTNVAVESCNIDFFYQKYKKAYGMFKNPRGLCLIVNIYQIEGMPPRRWSDKDTESLKQLFQQLLFDIRVYTDSTHDLTNQNFRRILREFAESPEHVEAQCAVICLMSHGEEGFLTTKEGEKVNLDDIFAMFNNINCPNLAGKPKLFFIQSCRDDPVTGPAEDLGVHLSYKYDTKEDNEMSSNTNNEDNYSSMSSGSASEEYDHEDETDGHRQLSGAKSYSDNNCKQLEQHEESELISNSSNMNELNTNNMNGTGSQIFRHMPSLCDMLIGFPTQKGFIAYRKPEIGSWYMNAIVQVFSKHAHDTDLCAMLNMVNEMISNEVTNTGKKQMSEYTSKFTKPYFYFFPGLACETVDNSQYESNKATSSLETSGTTCNTSKRSYKMDSFVSGSSKGIDADKRWLCESASKNMNGDYGYYGIAVDQADGSSADMLSKKPLVSIPLLREHLELVADRARSNWKQIAREVEIPESEIAEIGASQANLQEKLLRVLELWLANSAQKDDFENNFMFNQLVKVLSDCRLNKIKDELILKATQ